MNQTEHYNGLSASKYILARENTHISMFSAEFTTKISVFRFKTPFVLVLYHKKDWDTIVMLS